MTYAHPARSCRPAAERRGRGAGDRAGRAADARARAGRPLDRRPAVVPQTARVGTDGGGLRGGQRRASRSACCGSRSFPRCRSSPCSAQAAAHVGRQGLRWMWTRTSSRNTKRHPARLLSRRQRKLLIEPTPTSRTRWPPPPTVDEFVTAASTQRGARRCVLRQRRLAGDVRGDASSRRGAARRDRVARDAGPGAACSTTPSPDLARRDHPPGDPAAARFRLDRPSSTNAYRRKHHGLRGGRVGSTCRRTSRWRVRSTSRPRCSSSSLAVVDLGARSARRPGQGAARRSAALAADEPWADRGCDAGRTGIAAAVEIVLPALRSAGVLPSKRRTAHGIALTIDDARVTRAGSFELLGVKATATVVPGASAEALRVQIWNDDLPTQRPTATGMEIALERPGGWSRLAACLARWRASEYGGVRGGCVGSRLAGHQQLAHGLARSCRPARTRWSRPAMFTRHCVAGPRARRVHGTSSQVTVVALGGLLGTVARRSGSRARRVQGAGSRSIRRCRTRARSSSSATARSSPARSSSFLARRSDGSAYPRRCWACTETSSSRPACTTRSPARA